MGRSVHKILAMVVLCLGTVGFSFGQNLKTSLTEPQVDANLRVSHTDVAKKVLPADFPVYQQTGDEAADKENYAKRKAEWVEDNPERYAKLTNDESVKQ